MNAIRSYLSSPCLMPVYFIRNPCLIYIDTFLLVVFLFYNFPSSGPIEIFSSLTQQWDENAIEISPDGDTPIFATF